MNENDKDERDKRAQTELKNRINRTERWLSDETDYLEADDSAATLDVAEPFGAIETESDNIRAAIDRLRSSGVNDGVFRSVRFSNAESKNNANIHRGHRQRMRVSARRDKQLAAMSDIELIEYVLSFVIPQKNTNPLAHMLLEKYGSVLGVLHASAQELICFPNMTVDAATVLPLLTYMTMWDGCREIVLRSPSDAADFFGSVFLGGSEDGTYVAFLDAGYRLIAVEEYGGKDIPTSIVIGSASKYAASYVIFARRDTEPYPDVSRLNARIPELVGALEAIKAKLIDLMIFTDYGYYTVAPPKNGSEWYAKYIFIPTRAYARAVELAMLFGLGDSKRNG